MADIKDILQDDAELSNEQLMKYLNGKLSDAELHEVEKEMASSDFMNDAVEGLQSFKSKKNIDEYVYQLNHQLQKHTKLKKKKREKRRLKKNDWITLTIIIVLLLSLLGYIVVNKFLHHHRTSIQQTKQL